MPRGRRIKRGKSQARSNRGKSKSEKGFFHEISSDQGVEDKIMDENKMKICQYSYPALPEN